MLVGCLKVYIIKDGYNFEKCDFKVIQRCISTKASNTRCTCWKTAGCTWNFASLLYNRMTKNMGYGWERLKDIIEKEAEEEVKEQQQEEKVPAAGKWWYGFRDKFDARRKTRERIPGHWKFKHPQHKDDYGQHHTTHWDEDKGNLFIQSRDPSRYWWNHELQQAINFTTRYVYSLEEIQAYIEEYEQKRLDLDSEEVWSKAYLPAIRTTEARGFHESKLIFRHVQIRLVASNKPLISCGPLPDW